MTIVLRRGSLIHQRNSIKDTPYMAASVSTAPCSIGDSEMEGAGGTRF